MPSPAYEPSHCIVCGHSDADTIADDAAMRAQVEALWGFHQRRLKASTPVSRLRDRVAFSQHPPFRLVACRQCGLVYRNPVEREFELSATYARDAQPDDLLQALHATQRAAYDVQAQRLASHLPRGASVLEVGSYVGAFLGAARDAGLHATGVDINEPVNNFTRRLGFEVYDGALTSVGRQFDAIAIWNTFDQLADPRATLHAALDRLRPGGLLALRVPNGGFFRHWNGRRPRRFSNLLLAHNNLLTFPYRWGLSLRSLEELLGEVGFRPRSFVGDVLVPIADEWTRSWARLEERALKIVLKNVLSAAASAPWVEVYATAPGSDAT
jgi:SAM-dependent methyltransferase